jgi:hypothetical protein
MEKSPEGNSPLLWMTKDYFDFILSAFKKNSQLNRMNMTQGFVLFYIPPSPPTSCARG